jgi:hypothetical protein
MSDPTPSTGINWDIWTLDGLILFPTYGNWGGENYSNGKVGGNPRDPNGVVDGIDPLDDLFEVHDIAYALADNSDAAILSADTALINGIDALRQSADWANLSDGAHTYADLTEIAFEIKDATISLTGNVDELFDQVGVFFEQAVSDGNLNAVSVAQSGTGALQITVRNFNGLTVVDSYGGPYGSETVTSVASNADDGTSQVILYNANGSSVTRSYAGENGTGSITGQDIENADDTSQLTTYNDDGSSVTSNYSDPNGTGTLTQQIIDNADGTSTVATNDFAGNTLTVGYSGPDGTGTVTSEQFEEVADASTVSFSQFGSGVENALANEVGRLLSNNSQLVSLSAQALSLSILESGLGNGPTYTVDGVTLTGAQAFVVNFGNLLSGIVGGAAGAELGTKFFQALGLPTQLGSVLGSELGSVASQQLAADLAQEVFDVSSSLGGALGGLDLSNAGNIGALLGSELSDVITGQTGVGSSIGGEIGAIIGGALDIGAEIPGLGSLVGSFIGSLLGGLFGPGPSVGPNALAVVEVSGGRFVLGGSGADNGGNVAIAIDMANAAVQTLNSILTAVGGQVNSATAWAFGYWEAEYRALPTSNYPNYGPAYSDATTAVESGILPIIRSMQVSGGDPYVKWAVANSDATTLDQLVSDINVAQTYEAFITNPSAFELSLALANDPTQYESWLTDLARAQVLGLDRDPFLKMKGTSLTDTAADISANIVELQNLATNGELTSITLTDSGTPALALTVGQVTNDNAVLSIIAGPYHVAVTDVSTTVEENLPTLQALVASGLITSIALDDGGTPTLSIASEQLQYYTELLSVITTPSYLNAINDGTMTYLGAGKDFLGTGGEDQFFQLRGNLFYASEDDSRGQLVAGKLLTYSNGAPFLINPASTAIIWVGKNWIGDGGNDIITRQPANRINISEFNQNGVYEGGQFLSNPDGTSFLIDTGTTAVIWVGTNWSGDGGNDLITRQPGNRINISEFNQNGVYEAGQFLSYADGTSFLIDTGTTAVIWVGTNWSGDGGNDLITRQPGNRINISEFKQDGVYEAGQFLSYSDGSSFLFDTSTTTVIFVGHDLLGDSGNDLVTLQSDNVLNISEFNSSGQYAAGSSLKTVNSGEFSTSGLAVSDTAANVIGNIVALQALDGQLTSITLTDTITPTLSLTSAQLAADSVVLNKIGSAYNLTVSGVQAANAASVAGQVHVTSITVSDTAANVLANIAALQALGSHLASITLTDSTTPTLSLNAAQLAADSAVLSKIGSAYNLTVSGVLAANASPVAGEVHVTSITVLDTAANVLANIAVLQALGSHVTSITLSDSTTPTLSLTANQLAAYSAALGKISGTYNLTVSGVLAANAASVAGQAHVTSITVSDTAADVLANISTLEALESGGKVSSVTVSDTAANVLANISALRSLENSGNITAITIADTTADVLADVNALKPYTSAYGGPLTSIALTDGATPTLSLTPTQLSNDSAVLQDLTSYYDLTVSGGFVVLGNNQHVDISGSNDTVIPGLNDNFGVAGSNSSIMVDSEDGIFLTSQNGIADPLAALGANAVVGNGSGQTLSGGSGIDVIVGGGGNNTFVAPGAATGGTVTVWGGTPSAAVGSNTVDYSSYSGDLEIVLGQGESPGGPTGWVANSDTSQYLADLNDIDNVIGGPGNNTITGNSDNDIINGGNGNDWLTGGSGNDTFIVGTGNNTIKGGGGNATYQFGSSFGQDVINNGYGAVAKGAIDFASGITDEKLWFQQSGSDLVVGLLGTNDQIDVAGWFNGIAGNQVQTINAGGLKLDTGVASLVQAMATYAADNPSFNPATATSMPNDSNLQSAIAASWHH